MSIVLNGILPVLPTPYEQQGGIDVSAMACVVRFCVDAGAHGLVFPGVASEYDFLSKEERFELLNVVAETNNGALPIICGGGKGTAKEIGENIKQSLTLGITAAMVLIPTQFANDTAGAFTFMSDICALVPDTDIILQNAPQPIGAGLDPSSIAEIISDLPNVKYIKEEALPSGARITEILKHTPPHLLGVIGGGGARYLIDEINRGAIGAMPAAEITDVHVGIWNLYKDNQVAKARELYMQTLPLLLIQSIYRMRLTKRVLTLRGVLKNAEVRALLPEFDLYDEKEVDFLAQKLLSNFRESNET